MAADRSDLFKWEPGNFRELTDEEAAIAEREALARIDRLTFERALAEANDQYGEAFRRLAQGPEGEAEA